MTRSHKTRLFFILVLVLAGPALGNQINEDEPIDIQLENADLRETLQSFGAISGSQLDMSPDIEGSVTLDVKKVPWTEALDQVCRDHEIACEIVPGDPPVLRVRGAADSPLPPGFADAISMSLVDADLRSILAMFEKVTGYTVQVAEGVEGKVNVNFRSVPWPLVLTETCRLSGCRVLWGDEALEIVPAETDEALLINMSLVNADLRETLAAFGQIITIGSAPITAEIDESLIGAVTVDLRNVHWQQACDLVCEQNNCDWILEYGDPPVLKFMPRGSAGARPKVETEEPGAMAKALAYRFTPPGGTPVEGTAVFTWGRPVQVVPSPGPYRVRFAWIPFGAELSVVMPLIERCEKQQSSVVLLDPIVLPLEDERDHQVEGAVLRLSGAPAETAPSPPPEKAAGCGPVREGVILATVRPLDPANESPRPQRRLTVESQLLVTPVGAREPVAALISLGGDVEGRQNLALLRPSADRSGVGVETLTLALGESRKQIVENDEEHRFELRIEYLREIPRQP